MTIKNTAHSYGWVAILFHWSSALLVFGLFALGWWMTDLDYYHGWYQTAPWIHKSLGLCLAFWIILRGAWRWISPPPQPLTTHQPYEVRLAHWTHSLRYLLLVLIFVSGYLISTADGRPIPIFNWVEIPATLTDLPNQEDLAGAVHWYLALALIALVGLHAAGAMKHHLLDRDNTLKRMLRP